MFLEAHINLQSILTVVFLLVAQHQRIGEFSKSFIACGSHLLWMDASIAK